jgi:hypothetical protein
MPFNEKRPFLLWLRKKYALVLYKINYLNNASFDLGSIRFKLNL